MIRTLHVRCRARNAARATPIKRKCCADCFEFVENKREHATPESWGTQSTPSADAFTVVRPSGHRTPCLDNNVRLEFERPPRWHLKKRFQKKFRRDQSPNTWYGVVSFLCQSQHPRHTTTTRIWIAWSSTTQLTRLPQSGQDKQPAGLRISSVWRRSTTVHWARLRRHTSLHDQRLTSRAASM